MKARALHLGLASFFLIVPGQGATKPTKEAIEARQQARLFQKKLSKEQQVTHALDRLTFGPRPGDLARVKKLGLKKWIDLQLHPERIKESAELEAKLRLLESLRLTPLETVERYPTPQMIRAMAEGRQPLPADVLLRAGIERLIARYKFRKADDATKADLNADLEPVKSLDEVLEPLERRILRAGAPEQKRELLESMPPDKLEDLLIALPRGQRQQLLANAPAEVQRKIMMLNAPQQVVAYDLLEAKLLRAIESKRQLVEELDDFWFNHFNVYYDKGSDRFLIPEYEREAIRPHVLGKFRELLEATAKSPAMLFYLDNFQSVRPDLDANAKNRRVKRGLNENYGRELMELHTLGVNGGYTQRDVTEVARCFTGWTILEPRRGGGFFYNDNWHDKGEKVVLGHVIPAGGGIEDGQKVLDILASHPSAAKFISTKLAQRFVADNPPPALIDKMAKAFLATGGDIREVMKAMLDSKEFWSQGAYRAKIKTPFEMVVSSVRALDAKVDSAWVLANQIGNLGEPLYRKQEPTGYSNLNADWMNSAALLARMNFAMQLSQNRMPGVKVTAAQSAGLMLGSPDFQRR
jgi:uncharacterized protein (DUF1800 family)